jgi:sugar O-acyltransferase (sialic acid O-acetyltransferase NeuD family)
MKKELILLGAGGHCHSVIDVIEAQNVFSVIGILDKEDKIGTRVLGYEVIGTDDDLKNLRNKNLYFLVTIGAIKSSLARKTTFLNLIKEGFKIPTIISPLAQVSRNSSIGYGTVIHHFSMINSNANIGENCIINTGSIVEHDSRIGDHCHISTGTIINGGVKVENDCFIGSGSVVIQNITIGLNSIVGAGSLINKNLPGNNTYFGVPVKI